MFTSACVIQTPKNFSCLRGVPPSLQYNLRGKGGCQLRKQGAGGNDVGHRCQVRVPAFASRTSSAHALRLVVSCLPSPCLGVVFIHLRGFKGYTVKQMHLVSDAYYTDICLTAYSTIIHRVAEFPVLLLGHAEMSAS